MTSWEVATKTTRPDAAALAREFQEEGIVLPKPNSAINDKVAIYRGDMTRLHGDAIVNAANESLLGGGGIDGTIHRAAGPQLVAECRTLHGCETGHCKITKGYRLPSRHVIHAVGPIGEREELLRSCYRLILKCAVKNKIRTLAFCGLSTGIFGYPPEKAVLVAMGTVRKWLEVPAHRDAIDKIIFVVFTERETGIYNRTMPRFFPPTNNRLSKKVKARLRRVLALERKGTLPK